MKTNIHSLSTNLDSKLEDNNNRLINLRDDLERFETQFTVIEKSETRLKIIREFETRLKDIEEKVHGKTKVMQKE